MTAMTTSQHLEGVCRLFTSRTGRMVEAMAVPTPHGVVARPCPSRRLRAQHHASISWTGRGVAAEASGARCLRPISGLCGLGNVVPLKAAQRELLCIYILDGAVEASYCSSERHT